MLDAILLTGTAYLLGLLFRRVWYKAAEVPARGRMIVSVVTAGIVVAVAAAMDRHGDEMPLPPGFIGGCVFVGFWYALRRRVVTPNTANERLVAPAVSSGAALNQVGSTTSAPRKFGRLLGQLNGWWRLWLLGSVAIWLWIGYQFSQFEPSERHLGLAAAIKAAGPNFVRVGSCEAQPRELSDEEVFGPTRELTHEELYGPTRQLSDEEFMGPRIITEEEAFGAVDTPNHPEELDPAVPGGVLVEFGRHYYLDPHWQTPSICLTSGTKSDLTEVVYDAYYEIDVSQVRRDWIQEFMARFLTALAATGGWFLFALIVRWVHRGFSPVPPNR